MAEYGAHSKRLSVDNSGQPSLFDIEPLKTGWSKEEGDTRLKAIRERASQQYLERATSQFNDRRR